MSGPPLVRLELTEVAMTQPALGYATHSTAQDVRPSNDLRARANNADPVGRAAQELGRG